MLKLLREEYELSLIFRCKNVVIGLESLIKLVQACHFSHEPLRSREVSLLCRIFLQTAFIDVQLAIAGVAAVLDEFQQRVKMVDLG